MYLVTCMYYTCSFVRILYMHRDTFSPAARQPPWRSCTYCDLDDLCLRTRQNRKHIVLTIVILAASTSRLFLINRRSLFLAAIIHVARVEKKKNRHISCTFNAIIYMYTKRGGHFSQIFFWLH